MRLKEIFSAGDDYYMGDLSEAIYEDMNEDINRTVDFVINDKHPHSAYLYESLATYLFEEKADWRESHNDKLIKLIDLLAEEKNNRDGSHLFAAMNKDKKWCNENPDIVKKYWLSFEPQEIYAYGLQNNYDKKFPKEFGEAAEQLNEETKLHFFRMTDNRFDEYVDYLKDKSDIVEKDGLKTFSLYKTSAISVWHKSFIEKSLKQDKETFEMLVNGEWEDNDRFSDREALINALMSKYPDLKKAGNETDADKIKGSVEKLYKNRKAARDYIDSLTKHNKEKTQFKPQKTNLFMKVLNKIR